MGLTYRIVPEDNLIIITDLEGADDPMDRILSELQALHRDLHAVQDDVDGPSSPGRRGAGRRRVRKPTIIEEVPPGEGQQPAMAPREPRNSQPKPGAEAPPGAR